MAVVRTTVYLERELFERLTAVAREMGISRSKLMALALEEYLERHGNSLAVEGANTAHLPMPTPEE